MTKDDPNLITYGMNNSQIDYCYYQSIVSEQQQQQQQQQNLQNKSVYQESNNNNVSKKSSSTEDQSQQTFIGQHERPERPKTLDTLSTVVNLTTNSKILPFDEQEEWKKITEIMANFGTDSDILQEFNNSNSYRLHDRNENCRSNSIAGSTTTKIDRQRNPIKKMYSLKGSIKRKSGTQSPHSLLIHFLGEHQIDEMADTLMENGYDDIEFVRGILDESDLHAMEIKPEFHLKLMKAIDSDLQTPARAITTITKLQSNADKTIYDSKLSKNDDESHEKVCNAIAGNCENNSNSNNNNYSTMTGEQNNNTSESLSVNEWLNGIRLPQYAEVFRKHLYTDMDRISRIWEIELQAVLEINKIGHRKRILYSVGAVPTKNQKIFENIIIDSNKVNASHRSLVSISSHDSNNTNTSDPGTEGTEPRPNHRKNRQAPKPPAQAKIEYDIRLLTETATNLEIRAPSELLLNFPTGLRTRWRHSPELLITGAVKYEVNYLGSTIVKELRGTESTKKSIQKLKKSDHLMRLNSTTIGTHSAEKSVYILISYCGVQFVDPQTKGTICEHEIRNINCACQDADDLSHFAYITKDSDAHYCHVFNVASMDLATEIILTLGQAFEVAYQIALKKPKPATSSKSPINNLSVGQKQRI